MRGAFCLERRRPVKEAFFCLERELSPPLKMGFKALFGWALGIAVTGIDGGWLLAAWQKTLPLPEHKFFSEQFSCLFLKTAWRLSFLQLL